MYRRLEDSLLKDFALFLVVLTSTFRREFDSFLLPVIILRTVRFPSPLRAWKYGRQEVAPSRIILFLRYSTRSFNSPQLDSCA